MKTTRHIRLAWFVSVAVIALGTAALLAATFTAQTPLVERFDGEAYNAALARRVASVADIAADYECQQLLVLPIAPPDPDIPLTMPGGTLPIEPKGFSDAFLVGLIPAVRNGVVVYPITVYEDPLTQARVILNAAGQELARVAAPVDYDPLWYVEAHTPGLATMEPASADWYTGIYDPSRIEIAYDLIQEDALVQQVWQMSLLSDEIPPPPDGECDDCEGEGTNAPLSDWSGVVSNLQFVQIGRMETNLLLRLTLAYPEGFTNRISVITDTNLVVHNWTLFFTTNTSPSTNAVIFFDANFTTNNEQRFYYAYNADHDGDGDGVSDGEERFLLGTSTNNPNDPPNVKGTVSYQTYSGGQTGRIWIVAVTNAATWNTNVAAALAQPGAYQISRVPPTNYWIKAWRDSDWNGSPGAVEATGLYSSVAIAITGQLTNVNIVLTDPDTDGDGMGDWWEVGYFSLVALGSPTADGDSDKANNLLEYHAGTDPTNGFHDADSDGMSDDWEMAYGLNKLDAADAALDGDGDGYSNLEEYLNGGGAATDPTDPSSHPSGAIYVATTGSDAGAGTYASPYASVSNGISQAVTGNRVVVLPGTYTGAKNRGLEFAGKAILVTGIAGHREDTVLNCQGNDRGFYFRNSETTNSVLRGLTIKNGSGGYGGGIRCNNADPVISNCRIMDCEATTSNDDGGGGGIYADVNAQPRIEDCAIEDNKAVNKGGGVYLSNGGTVFRCSVLDNTAEDRDDFDGGGGIYLDAGGFVANSTISGNYAFYGGGVYCRTNTPSLSNCFIVDNEADNRAGGVYIEDSGSLTNCTITANQAYEYGGGIYVQRHVTVNNTIVYHNRAVVEPNRYNTSGGTKTYRNCCTYPTVGTGAVTNAPLLAGRENPHLLAASPCINTGTNAFASGLDIDGEARVYNATVDIGCDEYTATNLLGAIELEIDIVGGATGAVVNAPVTFEADTAGRIERFEWRIDTGSGLLTITNAYTNTYAWTTVGIKTVTLWATNSSGSTSTVVTVDIRSGYTNYVSPSGAHVWPFTTWANAATNIRSAISAGYEGGLILVTNGTYGEQDLVLEKAVTLRSVNGAAVTTVAGNGTHRCLRIQQPSAVLDGFKITGGGGDRRAGGVYIRGGGTVKNCTITGNSAENDGGGVFIHDGGTITNCTVANNTSGSDAGGIRVDYGGLVTDCIVTNNVCLNRGGGVHLHRFGTVRNCQIKWNRQTSTSEADNPVGGGLAFRNGWTNALVEFCTMQANTGFEGGGAHIESEGVSDDGVDHGRAILRNCQIIGNTAAYRAGGVNADSNGDVKNCLIMDNTTANYPSDEPDGGGARVGGGARLLNCTIGDNNAGTNGRGDGVRCQSDGFAYNCIIYFNDSDDSSIQSGGTIQYSCAADLSSGTGNITGSPSFVNRPADNYRLLTGSPCKNTGNNAHVAAGDLDLDGTTRIVSTTVDMGCYEFH